MFPSDLGGWSMILVSLEEGVLHDPRVLDVWWGAYLMIGWVSTFLCPLLLWFCYGGVIQVAFVGFSYVIYLNYGTLVTHHLGGNVLDDISTLIDVLFPKFELEEGGIACDLMVI